MRAEGWALGAWSHWLEVVTAKKGIGSVTEFNGCINTRCCIFKIVLADLGSAVLADPELRPHQRLREGVMEVCTMGYRPPDLYLGNTGFDQALDMWSLGCVAVELLQRRPLFSKGTEEAGAKEYLLLHLK